MPEPIFEITAFDPKTKQIRARLHPSARPEPQPWRWPLGNLGSREPIVLAEHTTDERRSVDLGYEPRPFDDELFVPVCAVQDGHIVFADGRSVTIEHDGEYATHYSQLCRVFVSPTRPRWKRRIVARAGEIIGYAMKHPTHMRFELRRWTEHGFVAIDPIPYLDAWRAPITPTKESV